MFRVCGLGFRVKESNLSYHNRDLEYGLRDLRAEGCLKGGLGLGHRPQLRCLGIFGMAQET